MTVYCRESQLDIESAGKRRTRYYCEVPLAHTIEDVLSPDYFGMMMSKNNLAVGDIIEVQAEDFSWYGELQVLACEPSTHQCITYQNRAIQRRGDVEFPAGYTAEWRGGGEGYRLLLKGEPIAPPEAGFASQEEAAVRAQVLSVRAAEAEAVRKIPPRKPKPAAKKKQAEVA